MQVNICNRLIKQSIESGNKIINPLKYLGTYAMKDFKKGTIIRKLQGMLVLNPTRESIHIGNGNHVIDDYGKYMNHSFEPNIKVVSNTLVALRDINKFEELTFNYNDTEINMAEPFEVNGIKVCGKQM